MSELNQSHSTDYSPMHQCPQCNKSTLLRVNNTKFKCIWCDFDKDLSINRRELTGRTFSGFFLVLTLSIAGFLGFGIFRSFSQPKQAISQINPLPIDPEDPDKHLITNYPKAACGYDMNQVEPGINIIQLYPVFVDNSPAVLEQIQTSYCQDAFQNKQNNLIQVASFRKQDNANEFRAFLATKFENAQVGESKPVKVQ